MPRKHAYEKWQKENENGRLATSPNHLAIQANWLAKSLPIQAKGLAKLVT